VPAEIADSERPQEAFPFMQLPPELRVMVYKLAIQDIVDPILSADSGDAKEPKQFHGALALLHTSQLVRLESCGTMRPIARAHHDILWSDLQALSARLMESEGVTHMDRCARDQIYGQYDEIGCRWDCIGTVTHAIDRAFWSQLEIREARIRTPTYDLKFRSSPRIRLNMSGRRQELACTRV
jgi:hypothetical protein